MKWRGFRDRYDLPGDLDFIDILTALLAGVAIGLVILAAYYSK